MVLPSHFPSLLVNGSSGIAVGMATNIPPHNLGEVVDGMCYLIDHPDATVDELNEFIKGPDFPTGGIVMGRSGIRAAYATGRGRIIVRGRAEIEESRSNAYRIVITEIPYMVNKLNLVKSMVDLVKEKRIEGIDDMRRPLQPRGNAHCCRAQTGCQSPGGFKSALQLYPASGPPLGRSCSRW